VLMKRFESEVLPEFALDFCCEDVAEFFDKGSHVIWIESDFLET
jgi:hypothetical protein